jgi:hypothetical protein
MQTTILASSRSTSIQRNKRPKKGKQPIEDDQPRPESVFHSSWIRAMPKKCNRVITKLFQLHFVKNYRYISILKKLCMTYPFAFLNADFVTTCQNGHFVMLVVDCLAKVFYFYDSLPSAAHRAWASILVNTYFSFLFSC